MEEKVKLSNLKNVDAGSLHRKYQDLLKAMRGKDELISQLEAQLEKQVRADAPLSTIAPCNGTGFLCWWGPLPHVTVLFMWRLNC